MTDPSRHQDDVPTQPSRPGLGSSDLLRRAFEGLARGEEAETAPPERIGPYRVLGRVGRGGMGSVYKASDERESSGRRLVAIKLVRKGLDTEDVLRRFKLERQLLASLNHPNIARLYDVAETEDERPYFVMEFIEGKPITQYCDERRATIAERLAIFRKVCDAVHHAHANLIVHRDLKPGNILVTPDGEPKLLDFGIAKLLNPTLGRVEVLTRPTMRIMTPEYASPEQVRGETVSTRSDVYSLGVLLYELLAGRRPYQFAKRIEAEVVRIICESEPVRPSTAVTTIDRADRESVSPTGLATPATIAQSRSAERVQSLRRTLSGDLDDIVMMALAKSPERRYPSADRFSQDLQRYLEGQPVEARKTPSRSLYHLRKFVKRRRTEVAAAALVALALLGGGVTTWQQTQETARANLRAADAARAESAALEARLGALEDLSIASAFGDVLWTRANENLNFIMTPSERDGFWKGVQEDFRQLEEQYDGTNQQVRRARSRAMLQAGHALGGIRAGNSGDFAAALAAYESAREDLTALQAELPDDEGVWADAIEAELRVADVLRRMNRPTEAMTAYERAIEVADAGVFQADELRTERRRSTPRMALGQTAMLIGNAEIAERELLGEVERRRERVERHPESLLAKRDLAVALLSAGEMEIEFGRVDAGREKLEESMMLRRELLAQRPTHPSLRRDVAVGRIALAIFEVEHGDAASAAARLERGLEELDELAAEAPDDARLPLTSATALAEYAAASFDAGRADSVRETVGRLGREIETLGSVAPLHPAIPGLRGRWRLLQGQLALRDGELEQAAERYELARDQLSSVLALDQAAVPHRLRLGDSLVGLGECRRLAGDAEAARASYLEARRLYETCGEPGGAFGPNPERWATANEHAQNPS